MFSRVVFLQCVFILSFLHFRNAFSTFLDDMALLSTVLTSHLWVFSVLYLISLRCSCCHRGNVLLSVPFQSTENNFLY